MQRLLDRMVNSHSLWIGLSIAVPTWLYSDHPTIEHAVMMLILITAFILDTISGVILAHKSHRILKTSHAGIDALLRDFLIVAVCTACIAIDFVLKTKSFVYAFFTGAFIGQTFYSFLGNVGALGWTKYFPMWLFNWVRDEMIAKLHKYFPHGKDDEK